MYDTLIMHLLETLKQLCKNVEDCYFRKTTLSQLFVGINELVQCHPSDKLCYNIDVLSCIEAIIFLVNNAITFNDVWVLKFLE